MQVTSWENWPLKTQSGDFEAVFSNVGINAARVKLFDFSSDRAAYMGFEAKKSSTYNIKGSDDISGLKISVGSGTNQEKILVAWNQELEANGKAPAVLQYYSSDADTILALSSGRTDLNIAPFPSVTYRDDAAGFALLAAAAPGSEQAVRASRAVAASAAPTPDVSVVLDICSPLGSLGFVLVPATIRRRQKPVKVPRNQGIPGVTVVHEEAPEMNHGGQVLPNISQRDAAGSISAPRGTAGLAC